MAEPRSAARVPLLATVVLLLDDEAEEIGRQLGNLCAPLDPLVQARLQLVRVTRDSTRLLGAMLAGNQGLFAVDSNAPALVGATSGIRPAAQLAAPQQRLGWQAAEPFADVLRATVAQAQHIGGAEALGAHGYRLVPNDLAIYLIGRVDTPWLADAAKEAHRTVRSLTEQSDARRFALLVAAPPPEASFSTPGARDDWRDRAARQPWHDLLAWRDPRTGQVNEPPLHYAFLYEPWDDKSQFLRYDDVHYAMAESLFMLFSTGLLEDPGFKDALDFSMAPLDSSPAINRVGSIGTSLVAEPSVALTRYLSYRLAADVLIQRNLIGAEGGVVLPDAHRHTTDAAVQQAEIWRKQSLLPRLIGDKWALPGSMPPRLVGPRGTDTWDLLALGPAVPDPSPLTTRWQVASRRLIFDDEKFWNLTAQIEFETSNDFAVWRETLAKNYAALSADLQREMGHEISQRALAPEGLERGGAFAQALTAMLQNEMRATENEGTEVVRQLQEHHLHLTELLRSRHASGVPRFPEVRPLREIPRMAPQTESLFHDVIDSAFARTPAPATLVLLAVVLAIFGAAAVGPLSLLPGVAHLPAQVRTAMTGPASHFWGAGAMLALYVIVLLCGVAWRVATLKRWERDYARERTLLWLGQARGYEHRERLAVLRDLIAAVQQRQVDVQRWRQSLSAVAAHLNDQAYEIATDGTLAVALSRDLYITQGTVWDGANLDDLYLHQRERLPESRIGAEFLLYVQSRSGDVDRVLDEGGIEPFAVEFMSRQLAASMDDPSPFEQMNAEQSRVVVDRALAAARVPLRPRTDGTLPAHFDCVAANGALTWIARAASEQHLALVPVPRKQWILVAHVTTRTTHALVN
jgi:hypothetical protein